MKKFSLFGGFDYRLLEEFTEETAPKWLCEGGIKGSTMDNRWFWNDHVLALDIGESAETDFTKITRTE